VPDAGTTSYLAAAKNATANGNLNGRAAQAIIFWPADVLRRP